MLLLFVQNCCRIPRGMRGLKVSKRQTLIFMRCRIPRGMRGLKLVDYF